LARVQYDHRGKFGSQRLLQYVTCLRQRPFAGVYQQEHAVHHAQRALHFAAEIAVARGVHDIDLGVVKKQRGILGQNGDAPLALQVVGIHHAFHQRFVGAENSALPQHGVHQRGFPMVYVGDDGDIANILTHKF
jgi:hypothetical protein